MKPFPVKPGVFIELRGGDVCDPVMFAGMGGNWFNPPWPKRVVRFFCRWKVLPFVAYRFGNRAGYAGFKAYGVDSEAYKNWMPEADVYAGSQAMCLSIRPFATLKEGD